MTLDKSTGFFLPFLIIEILKQVLKVYFVFIFRDRYTIFLRERRAYRIYTMAFIYS